MLDTSDQDLNSIYCDTQGSKTEDDNEQSLFISRSVSGSENKALLY